MTQEESRLQEARKGTSNWKKWGPKWGTVREDYSEGGDAAEIVRDGDFATLSHHPVLSKPTNPTPVRIASPNPPPTLKY